MLLSELYKIMVKKVIFIGFWGKIAPLVHNDLSLYFCFAKQTGDL